MAMFCDYGIERESSARTVWYIELTTEEKNPEMNDKEQSLEELYAKPVKRRKRNKIEKNKETEKLIDMSGYDEVGSIIFPGHPEENDHFFRERSSNIKHTTGNQEQNKRLIPVGELKFPNVDGNILHKKLEALKSDGYQRIKQQRTSVRRKKLNDNPALQVREHVTITPPSSRRPSAFPIPETDSAKNIIISPNTADLTKRFENIWARFSDIIDSPSTSSEREEPMYESTMYEEIWRKSGERETKPNSPVYVELEFENNNNFPMKRYSQPYRNSYLDVQCFG